VIELISRVTNDSFQFCAGLDLNAIYVGCRHYVRDLDGHNTDQKMILYKIRIRREQLPQLVSNPFLNSYSTTGHFEVEKDNFDEIQISISTIRL